MKIFTVYINTHEDYSQRPSPEKKFTSRKKAEQHIAHLKNTVFKNYGATLEIREERIL